MEQIVVFHGVVGEGNPMNTGAHKSNQQAAAGHNSRMKKRIFHGSGFNVVHNDDVNITAAIDPAAACNISVA